MEELQFVSKSGQARMSLSLVRLPTHMDGFLYPLGKILHYDNKLVIILSRE